MKIDLASDNNFKDLDRPNQEVMKLYAEHFETSVQALYEDEQGLVDLFDIGTEESWGTFLALPSVKMFTKDKMKQRSDVQIRKTVAALAKQAGEGNAQAAKAMKDILDNSSKDGNHNVVVLHYIPRPLEKG